MAPLTALFVITTSPTKLEVGYALNVIATITRCARYGKSSSMAYVETVTTSSKAKARNMVRSESAVAVMWPILIPDLRMGFGLDFRQCRRHCTQHRARYSGQTDAAHCRS